MSVPPLPSDTPIGSPAAPTEQNPSALFTIAGHKVTTHSLAVALGMLLMAAGPAIVQRWPEAAPMIEQAQQGLPSAVTAESKMGPYESHIRSAWASEKDAPDLSKKEKLKRLIFLYRRTAFEAESKSADLGELSKSFHDEADKLGMVSQLPIVRGVIAAEWNATITEKAPAPLTEPLRAKISAFVRDTIAILERLLRAD